MTAQTILLRMIDGFFRRKWLFVLPIVVFGILGFASAALENDYRSEGSIFVQEETFLSQLTEVRQTGLSFQTPAEVASEQLYGLLQTDNFVGRVLELSGQNEAIAGNALDEDEVVELTRQAISTWPSGQNFLNVGATWEDPEVAHELALATVEGMVLWQIEADQVQSREAEEFFGELVDIYQSDLDIARTRLNDYLIDHPDPTDSLVNRPTIEVVAIEALQSDIRVASGNLEDALNKNEEARLATAQTRSDVRQGFLVVDVPNKPTATETGLFASVVRAIVFGIVGGFTSAAILVLTTLLESSRVRFPVEIEERLGLPIAAVVVRQP